MELILLLLVPLIFCAFPKFMRHQMFARDDARCVRCGRSWYDGWMLEMHHKIPLHNGGPNTIENGETLCLDCHAYRHLMLAKEDKKRGDKKSEAQNMYAFRLIKSRSRFRRGFKAPKEKKTK